MRLVLASGSPRRKDILAGAGIACEIAPVDIDEDPHRARPGAPPAEVAIGLAQRKALARASLEAAPGLVLGADTVVVAPGGALLGKPADAGEARQMALALSGREHEVVTGIALHDVASGRTRARAVSSRVRFFSLTNEVIEAYLARGLWRGKAGGYGAQDPAPGGRATLVERIEGSETNVIGLPLEETRALLEEAAA
jgi:septum formation protein